MIRSLRFRFFLTVWPLVVAAVLAVGVYFGAWTRIELRREAEISMAGAGGPHVSAAEVEEAWSDVRSWEEAAGVLASLSVGGEAGDFELWVVDASGGAVARSSDRYRIVRMAVDPAGALEAQLEVEVPGGLQDMAIRLPGVPLAPPAALTSETTGPLRLFTVPAPDLGDDLEPGPEGVEAVIRSADRAILSAVMLAAVVAGIATLLLARPVVGSATTLADAARRIRRGDLSTRVGPMSSDELGEVGAAFDEMADELERSEQAKRRMISDAAHELRTPLTNLVGSVEAMRDGLMPMDESGLASVREEIVLLERLVEDLQEIAVADADGLRLDVQPVDLAALAEECVDRFAPVAARRSLRLSVQSGGDVVVAGDRLRLAQAIRNLLDNAIRHSPEAGRVQVVVEGRDAAVDVTVEDEGPGIPADHRARVWEPFHRVDDSRHRGSGGSGLGLPIVARFVAAHAGRVRSGPSALGGAAIGFSIPRDPHRSRSVTS